MTDKRQTGGFCCSHCRGDGGDRGDRQRGGQENTPRRSLSCSFHLSELRRPSGRLLLSDPASEQNPSRWKTCSVPDRGQDAGGHKRPGWSRLGAVGGGALAFCIWLHVTRRETDLTCKHGGRTTDGWRTMAPRLFLETKETFSGEHSLRQRASL